MQNETRIWQWFKAKTELNDYAIAGIMGNIQAESDGLPNNVENRSGISDTAYTMGVDNGTYAKWETDAYGYGLCQWTYYTRKRALLTYAKQKNTSIGNLEMQLEFIVREMQMEYGGVWQKLLSANNLLSAVTTVCEEYERPANASAQTKIRHGYAEQIYARKHNAVAPVQEPDAGNIILDAIELLKKAVELL